MNRGIAVCKDSGAITALCAQVDWIRQRGNKMYIQVAFQENLYWRELTATNNGLPHAFVGHDPFIQQMLAKNSPYVVDFWCSPFVCCTHRFLLLIWMEKWRSGNIPN